MITGLIAAVVVIAMIAAWGDGETTAVAVGAVIVVVVLLLGHAGRQNARAYNNFVRYWSDGGPDRER